MRLSQLFTKTSKNAPADEVSKNAQLLIRAGFVYKEMAGVYAYLPLGLRVIDKIKQIVREEMDGIRSSELIMAGLQRKDVWKRPAVGAMASSTFGSRLSSKTKLSLALAGATRSRSSKC